MKRLKTVVFLTASVLSIHASGQCGEIVPLAGVESTADAPSVGEAERLAAVRRQIHLNELMRWRNGFPSAMGVFYPALPYLNDANAYGRSAAWGLPDHAWTRSGASVFTPWPYLPGDIWGERVAFHVRQSVGQAQVQTGPNRWESFPIYAPPPTTPVESEPAAFAPMPIESRSSGPREF